MYQIDISNQQSFLEIDQKKLTEMIQAVCEKEKVARATLSVAILDNASIRTLNARYLEHDYETDVLSFLLECRTPEPSSSTDPNAPRGEGKEIEGDVIVSAEMAVNCAEEYGWSPENELTLYLIHGVLHLLGYDDLSYDEKQLMRSKEKECLELFGLTPAYREDDLEMESEPENLIQDKGETK